MSILTSFFEIPGGELRIELLEDSFILSKRMEPSETFTKVLATEDVDDLITTVIEHTVSNTLLAAYNGDLT